jgi:hypothetical protein
MPSNALPAVPSSHRVNNCRPGMSPVNPARTAKRISADSSLIIPFFRENSFDAGTLNEFFHSGSELSASHHVTIALHSFHLSTIQTRLIHETFFTEYSRA